MSNAIRIPTPPMQRKITSTTTNYNIFSDVFIANELSTKYGLTSEKIAQGLYDMKITFLPDTSCTVIVNDSEYDAPDFYSTSEIAGVRSFRIKENGISGLLIITIA